MTKRVRLQLIQNTYMHECWKKNYMHRELVVRVDSSLCVSVSLSLALALIHSLTDTNRLLLTMYMMCMIAISNCSMLGWQTKPTNFDFVRVKLNCPVFLPIIWTTNIRIVYIVSFIRLNLVWFGFVCLSQFFPDINSHFYSFVLNNWMDHIPERKNEFNLFYLHSHSIPSSGDVFFSIDFVKASRRGREEKNLNKNYVLYSINWNEILR